MEKNPLSHWFRKPGIHVRLPSQGNYNPRGMFEFAAGNSVPIYPMTAADEIIVANPDSLLNGSALERIITSCCPAVYDVKDVVIPDADVIILATKLVSYGDSLSLRASCPRCKKGIDFVLSIKAVLGQAKPLPTHHSVRLNDDLVAYLRPYTLESNNKINLTQFEQSKRIQNLETDEIPESDRSAIITNAFEIVTNLNLELLSNCIMKIATPGSEVTDPDQIREFVDNASRDIVKLIRDSLEELNKYGLPKTTEITCDDPECAHTWDIPIVYDPSSFFGLDS